MPHILAIDQSTSATKAILFDAADGRVVDRESLPHRQIYPQPGWVEHDAEEIWRNTVAVVRAVAQRHPREAGELACLSLTNQRETVVVFDRATGKPLHNAIVWQCRRGAPVCDQLSRDPKVAADVSAKTGLRIDTYFSAPKLAWLVQNHPDLAAKLAEGSALIGTIDAYLVYRLTRGEVFATDVTNASRTLLYDITRLRWDDDLCRTFRVPPAALPEPRDSTARFGSTDAEGALPRPVPIQGVMGDSQASLFAHRCFQPGSAKVTLGSGSSVLLNTGPQHRPASGAAVSTLAWSHRGQPCYCYEGIINYSAATVEWLKDQLRLINSADETEAAARAVPDNGGVYLVPAFAGLSAPHWSPTARAAIVGLTAHATREHVVRAALESIAYQIRDALDAMRACAGTGLLALRADGGATRNAFLMQFIADLARVPIAAAQLPECSALGAAMAGALGAGIYSSLEELSAMGGPAVTYAPLMPEDEAGKLHAGWRRAVKQVLAGVEPA